MPARSAFAQCLRTAPTGIAYAQCSRVVPVRSARARCLLRTPACLRTVPACSSCAHCARSTCARRLLAAPAGWAREQCLLTALA
eukprot:11419520-Alexandrium_andersonii.AAC.1